MRSTVQARISCFQSRVALRSFGSHRGVVKWFNAEKGYGFIEAEGQDYFVHYTAIDNKDGGFRSLADGEQVEFDMEPDARNPSRMRAANVTGPDGAPVKGTPRPQHDDAW